MFLPARLALLHSVYFGQTGAPMAHLVDLSGAAANVAQLQAPLEPNTHYIWRVDTHTAHGVVDPGAEWTFMTGQGDLSCNITPHPPPQPSPHKPPAPGPGQCPAACHRYCPGLAGKDKQCEDCVIKHSSELHAAGCWTASGHGGRHSFITEFCDGK